MLKVSVIIPAHNAGGFIADALTSALGQTAREIEIIVVDDGSSDNTAEIVAHFCERDARVILLRHTTSRGVSAARNTAIARSAGIWIAPLDADDEFAPERLETLVRMAEERSLDVLADNLNIIDFRTKRHLRLAFPPEWMTAEKPIDLGYLLERDIPGSNIHRGFGFMKPLIRRMFLQSAGLTYAEDIWLGEDFLLYAELLLANARFGVTDAALYTYSFREVSASNRRNGMPQLIEVNRRIARRVRDVILCRGEASRRSMDTVEEALKTRDQALRYEHFLKYAKEGRLTSALAVVARTSPVYVTRRFAATLGRRIGAI